MKRFIQPNKKSIFLKTLISLSVVAGLSAFWASSLNANLVLQGKVNEVCTDLFCNNKIKIPYMLLQGDSVITRQGIAKWTALFNSAQLTQLSCTKLELKQSQLWLGALVLDVRISPVIGCHYKPKVIINAKKLTNKNSQMRYGFIDKKGQNRYVSIVGTELAVGESAEGNALVGVKSGVTKLDTGESLGAGYFAEAKPSGWDIKRSLPPYLRFTSSKSKYGDPTLLVSKNSNVFVGGIQVELNKDRSVTVAKGSNVDVVDVTGNMTSWHVASHGLRVTLIK
jgi:hypothetical protein